MTFAAVSKNKADLSPLARQVESFLESNIPAQSRSFLIACSGGPDSVALARAVKEIATVRPLRAEIGHVNHRLRGRSSAADQRFVQRLSGSLDLRVNVVQRAVKGVGNMEERARDLRYEALCAIARRRRLGTVLTGHTLEDQAETVLMNAIRGCGPEGLGGMRPVRQDVATGVTIARPLLKVPRREVRAYAVGRGGFRVDESNLNPRFLRNYLRINVFNELERRSPGFQDRIARLAELVRGEQPLLEQLTERGMQSVGRPYRGGWLLDHGQFRRLNVGIQRRVLRKAGGRDLLTFDGVERLRSWMASRPSSGRVWQLRKGWIVERLSKSGGSPSPTLFWFRKLPSANGRSRKIS